MVAKKLFIFASLLLFVNLSFVFVMGYEDDFEFHPKVDFTGDIDSLYVVKVTDALTANGIKSVLLEVGQTGKAASEFGTNSEMVNIAIFKIQNRTDFLDPGNILSEKNVGTFATDELILLNVISGVYNALTFEGEVGTAPIEYTPEVVKQNESEEIVNETVVAETSAEGSVTGNVVSEIVDFSKSNAIFLIIGLVVITGAFVFFIMRKNIYMSHSNSSSEPRVVKLSEMNKRVSDGKLSAAEAKLARAEQELKDARREISNIKSRKNELSEAEEEFRKAKEKLDGLRGLRSVSGDSNSGGGGGGDNRGGGAGSSSGSQVSGGSRSGGSSGSQVSGGSRSGGSSGSQVSGGSRSGGSSGSSGSGGSNKGSSWGNSNNNWGNSNNGGSRSGGSGGSRSGGSGGGGGISRENKDFD